MAEPDKCWGHGKRLTRQNEIIKMLGSSKQPVDENFKILIRTGPMSKETSLKEIEESYASTAAWRKIEDGGILGIPLEEFRMIHPPRPDQKSGQFDFGKGQHGKGAKIENYTVAETITNLSALVHEKFTQEKVMAKAAGMSEAESDEKANAEVIRSPLFNAVSAWRAVEAEIKTKKALEDMMEDLKIPALVIRSVSKKAILALNDLGLNMHKGESEIDLITAYASGDFLHVVICEVKSNHSSTWLIQAIPLSKQAVDKAEKQLTKDDHILVDLLAGLPPSQIVFHTLACFPNTSSSYLQNVICRDCLDRGVICQEDFGDLSLLQMKTQVPGKADLATAEGKKKLLTISARLLSHQSLLHVGYREEEDTEKLVSERHRYNLESVDGKILQKEFVVASPQ